MARVTPAVPGGSAPPKKILLVEDDPGLRRVVRITLERPSRRLLEAEDGVQALRLIEAEQPDLVLLDWMIPGLSGIEIAQRLQRNGDGSGPAVVMLTGRDQEEDRENGRQAGVFAYLVKPFSPLQLIHVVEKALGEDE
jgi:two-component system phosphate regulon response regulator PhoB